MNGYEEPTWKVVTGSATIDQTIGNTKAEDI